MCSKYCNTKAVPNAVKDMAEMGGAVSVSVTFRASVKLGFLSPLTESEEESIQWVYAKVNEEEETAAAELSG